ncbi:MAG: proline dehydrogenase family protein [Bacteroidota bacterium]
MKINFGNTQIAFSDKNVNVLSKMQILFVFVAHPSLVSFGKTMLRIALFLHLPIRWILKPTLFRQFCGGETIDECKEAMQQLANNNIHSILDYSAEGIKDKMHFDMVVEQILSTIDKSKSFNFIPFAVFKLTGIVHIELLEKMSCKMELTASELKEYDELIQRVEKICSYAQAANIPVMMDAEESWIQPAIDSIVEDMTEKYNREKPFVYNTLQMYRTDRLDYLKTQNEKAQKSGHKLGYKIVRGAYMEKERERAIQHNYPSPIYPTKSDTDTAYNQALDFCIEHKIALCAGTHNEESCYHLIQLLENHTLQNDDSSVFFAQLYGMSDHISYNLSVAKYNVAKYLPYGPLKLVLPYLIRRAEENTSIKGQTGRELQLIVAEKNRRKQEGIKN